MCCKWMAYEVLGQRGAAISVGKREGRIGGEIRDAPDGRPPLSIPERAYG